MAGHDLITRPLFITFEGAEGAGKGVQKYKFAKFLQDNDNGILGDKYSDYIMSREPTKYSEAGRTFNLKLRNKIFMTAKEQTEFVIIDRFNHDKDIRKEILKNKFYICDRYFDSTGAYQVLQGMDWKTIYDKHKFHQKNGIIIPDITIYFSISGETSLKRTQNRKVKDSFDEDINLISNLDEAYMFWFKKTNDLIPERRLIIVNGEQSIDAVTQEMFSKVTETIRKNYNFFKPR